MGLPQPVIQEIGGRVRVSLSAVAYGPPSLDEIDRLILARLPVQDGSTTAELAKAIGRTPELRARGLRRSSSEA